MAVELINHPLFSDATLKAYYRFEDDALTTDSSGEGHTLTAISDPAEDASGKFGGAVALDGNDAYSYTDHSDFKPTGNFTIGMWVKSTSTTTNGILFQSWSQNSNLAGIRLWLDYYEYNPSRLRFDIGRNTGTTENTDWKQMVVSNQITDGNWNFVVATWDGSYLRIYINGSSVGTPVAWTYAPGYAATNYVRIGCNNNSGTDRDFFTGSLDDVFLLNGIALTSNQVLWLYTSGIKSINGLARASIKSINGLAIASVKSRNGLA